MGVYMSVWLLLEKVTDTNGCGEVLTTESKLEKKKRVFLWLHFRPCNQHLVNHHDFSSLDRLRIKKPFEELYAPLCHVYNSLRHC